MNYKTFTLLVLLIGPIIKINAQNFKVPDSETLKHLSHNINVDANYKSGDWTSILNAVKDKRIVLLGEMNHGAKEIFESRNDLIKALHEQLNFDVILFESGFGELAAIEMDKENITAKQMTYSLFGPWRTNEFVDLMSYIKSNEISIGGYDVQRTGGTFMWLLKSHFDPSDKMGLELQSLENEFTTVTRQLTQRNAVFETVKPPTTSLISSYQEILRSHTNMPDLVNRTIENRIGYLQYFLKFVDNKDWNKRWESRDQIMADNIEWHLKTKYKDLKIIVIGHNFHISKFNKKEEVMGEFLKLKYDSEMYSLGIFVGKGSFLGNYGNEENMSPASTSSLDIKHIIAKLRGKVTYLNMPSSANGDSNWLFKDIISNDTFIDLSNTNKMTLSKHFDGVILIDKSSVPIKY